MGQWEFVELNVRDLIARVRIKRAATLNALNEQVLRELHEVFASLQMRSDGAFGYADCRAVIICGEGEKSFIAGADIKVMQAASGHEIAEFTALGQAVMREIELTPLPIIAMIHGFAFGGGLELALACDFIVCSEKAKLGQPEVNLGLIPGFGGTQRLVARCGVGVAKRLILTGETIDGKEAHRLGIADYLFDHGDLEEKTGELAKLLASKPPLAIAAAKRVIDSFHEGHKLAGLAREEAEFIRLFGTADTKEGLAAFVEKRKTKFSGK